jgi:hypothetical protein
MIPTYTIPSDGVQEIPATGVHRFVSAIAGESYYCGFGASYYYGFGATEPTEWSAHKITLNDGFNAPDAMGKMWIYNQSDVPLSINVHKGS